VVIGSNPTEAHPIVGARIRQAVLKGARLIVIDPRKTALTRIADIHLQLRPGANVPLFNALACALVEGGAEAAKLEGWEAYKRFILEQTPEKVEESIGIEARVIRQAARLWGEAKRPMMVHGLGVSEHFQGSESVTLLCNLAILTQAVGREGVGVNPLRGQNNVQGAADMGCQPDLLTGYLPVSDPAVRERVGEIWGVDFPESKGRRLFQMYDAARVGCRQW
jgi:formate dehydrogenase major subunit